MFKKMKIFSKSAPVAPRFFRMRLTRCVTIKGFPGMAPGDEGDFDSEESRDGIFNRYLEPVTEGDGPQDAIAWLRQQKALLRNREAAAAEKLRQANRERTIECQVITGNFFVPGLVEPPLPGDVIKLAPTDAKCFEVEGRVRILEPEKIVAKEITARPGGFAFGENWVSGWKD